MLDHPNEFIDNFNASIPEPLGDLCREGRLEKGCFSELLESSLDLVPAG